MIFKCTCGDWDQWPHCRIPLCSRAPLVSQMVKNPPAMWDIWIRSLNWEHPLEEGMATHSIILVWRIPMDRGAWRVTVHGVAKSHTCPSDQAHTYSAPARPFLPRLGPRSGHAWAGPQVARVWGAAYSALCCRVCPQVLISAHSTGGRPVLAHSLSLENIHSRGWRPDDWVLLLIFCCLSGLKETIFFIS